MPDEATQFMTARVTDDTTGPNVDVAWQNLEAAIRNAFGFPADTDLTPAMDITAAGAVTLPVSLTLASGSTVDEILNDDDFAGAADDQLATAISIKHYVDAAVAGGGAGISHGDLSDRDSDSDGHSIYALLAGTRGTQTFAAGLEINGTLTTGNHVIMNGSTKVLQVAGPVSFNNTSGPPQASADPSVGTDLVRKSYADVHYGGGGGGAYLPLDGSEAMTGNLDMGDNKIVNLADPQSNQDAATMKYVDDEVAAVAGIGAMGYSNDSTTGSDTWSDWVSEFVIPEDGTYLLTYTLIQSATTASVTGWMWAYMAFSPGATLGHEMAHTEDTKVIPMRCSGCVLAQLTAGTTVSISVAAKVSVTTTIGSYLRYIKLTGI